MMQYESSVAFALHIYFLSRRAGEGSGNRKIISDF